MTQALALADKIDPPSISKGEKQYDWLVYTGLNYLANLAVSLMSADYFTHGAGRGQLNKVIGATEKAFINGGIMKSANALKTSKAIWETLALTSGGIMASLLTKPLEDNKRPIVHWLNKRAGVDMTAADGHEMTADEIYIRKEQPPQSWCNVIMRRIFASIVIVSAGSVLEHTIGMDKTKEAVVNTVNKGLNSGVVPGGKTLAASPMFQRYLGFAALDTFFAGVHATVMKLTNGSGKKHAPPLLRIAQETVAEPASPVAEKKFAVAHKPRRASTEEHGREDILPMSSYANLVSTPKPAYSLAS